MSWLRIDDGFASHPKIAALTDRELRVWLRLLCHCAKYKNGGEVGAAALKEVKGLTAKIVDRYRSLGLVDQVNGSSAVIHDWAHYNPKDPTAAERQARKRERDGSVT